MKVIYHGDSDGYLSAAIIARHTGNVNPEDYLCMNSYEDAKKLDAELFRDEDVYILDFSLKGYKLKELMEVAKDVIWIDHHDNGIYYNTPLKGCRYYSEDKPKAGCLLTWEYLYGNKPVPLIIEVVSVYDTWQLKNDLFAIGDNTNVAIKYTISDSIADWKEFLIKTIHNPELVNELAALGANIKESKTLDYARQIRLYSSEHTIKDSKFLCLNNSDRTSHAFGDKLKEYDACIAFYYHDGMYHYSIYSHPDSEFLCNEFAKYYGGGGHAHAAGFQLDYNLFKK